MQENVNIPDSTITSALTFRNLVLMNMQQLTNFPYIEQDFDALTDYELLCLVVKYLNDVIDNQNDQNDSITNMYNAFLALQTYVNNTKDTLEDAFNTLDNYVRTFFANLDVQDEIDHKLDEMVEDGTLQNIIASFLQTQKIYNTHAEMLADVSSLVDGLRVQTLGYFNINDNGGAFYIVTDTANQDEWQESIGDGLYLELIPEYEISSVVFGDPTSSENDSTLLQSIFDYISAKKLHLHLRNNKTYNIGTKIKVNSNLYLDMNSSTFKMVASTNDCFLYNMDNYTTQSTYISDITIKNGTFDGNSESNYNDNLAGMCLILYNGNNIKIEDLKVYDVERNPFNIFETSNISFKNILFQNICRRTSSYITGGNYCINMENRNGYTAGSHCNIENITLNGCGGHFIHCFKYSFCNIENLNIINPYDNTSLHSVNLTYTASNNCNISNVYVEGTAKNFCEVNQGSKNIYFNNIKVVTSEFGFVFGPNTDTSTINKNIYLDNSDITSTAYVFTYNYSDNCYFTNCTFNGGLGGADTNATNLFINNCNITTPTNRLFALRRATITNSKLNDYLVKSFERTGNIDITVNFELAASGSTTISLPMLTEVAVGSRGFKLCVTSWFPSSTNQMYQALYLYNISSNNSDVGSLSSSPISELGSSYRKIVPACTTHNVIDISTTSDTALGCQLHLFM